MDEENKASVKGVDSKSLRISHWNEIRFYRNMEKKKAALSGFFHEGEKIIMHGRSLKGEGGAPFIRKEIIVSRS